MTCLLMNYTRLSTSYQQIKKKPQHATPFSMKLCFNHQQKKSNSAGKANSLHKHLKTADKIYAKNCESIFMYEYKWFSSQNITSINSSVSVHDTHLVGIKAKKNMDCSIDWTKV